jgi:hypothetical protein
VKGWCVCAAKIRLAAQQQHCRVDDDYDDAVTASKCPSPARIKESSTTLNKATNVQRSIINNDNTQDNDGCCHASDIQLHDCQSHHPTSRNQLELMSDAGAYSIDEAMNQMQQK